MLRLVKAVFGAIVFAAPFHFVAIWFFPNPSLGGLIPAWVYLGYISAMLLGAYDGWKGDSSWNRIFVIPDKYRKKLEERKELEQDIEAEVDSE